MSANNQIQRLPDIYWLRDLNGRTTSNNIPSAASDGVCPMSDLPGPTSPGNLGPRVHVALDYTVSTGTMSATVALYGYTSTGTVLSAEPRWFYLGSLNGGSSMAANTSKWSPDASTIRTAEAFSFSGQQFSRFATRAVIAGANDLVTTYIGIERG